MNSPNTNPSDSNDDDRKSCLSSSNKEPIQTNKYQTKKNIHGHNVKCIKRSYHKFKQHLNWKGGRIKQR
jgi:hypothetical protein